MRAVLFHCKDFRSKITGLATRPASIVPSAITSVDQEAQDLILAFVTVEKGDNVEKAEKIAREIRAFCEDTKHKTVFLCPFAHLSNNLANCNEAKGVLVEIAKQLKASGTNLTEGHYGSDKELLIHLYGHPGNARYREF